MSAAFLQQIDWTRPWLAQVRERGEVVAHADDWRTALNRSIEALGVRNHRGLPIHFVPQSDLPPGIAYEQFISDTGGVPTRDNLHDFFNALVWLHFPRIKVQLNAIQAAEIERRAGNASAGEARAQPHGQVRGKVRDAATIFDENAVLFVASDPSLIEALRTHDWHTLFIARHAELQSQCRVLLFGHALMEKLVQPYKAITGHAWIVVPPCMADGAVADSQATDAAVAQQLAGGLSTADFSPLPVLGVPGWWQGQDAAFYADTSVFRPPRQR